MIQKSKLIKAKGTTWNLIENINEYPEIEIIGRKILQLMISSQKVLETNADPYFKSLVDEFKKCIDEYDKKKNSETICNERPWAHHDSSNFARTKVCNIIM